MSFCHTVAATTFLIAVGCGSPSPTITHEEYPPPYLAKETDYLDAKSATARKTIDEYWSKSGYYYLWSIISEDTYYAFYYPQLNKAEMELDELNYFLLLSYGNGHSNLENARKHLSNLEDILNVVGAKLSGAEVDFIESLPADSPDS